MATGNNSLLKFSETQAYSKMTRREQAILKTLSEMGLDGFSGSQVRSLEKLIDQAEAGKLKEPLPMRYVGSFGIQTVYPDGRIETA